VTDRGSHDAAAPDRSGPLGWVLVGAQFVILGALGLQVLRRGRGGAVGVLGVTLGLAAVVLIGWATNALGRFLRAHPAPADEAVLRTEGAYGLVRHPIYLGLLLGAAGAALIARTRTAAAALGALAALLHVKSRLEERLLTERFPGYPEYAREVPRLLPRFDRCPYPVGGTSSRTTTPSSSGDGAG